MDSATSLVLAKVKTELDQLSKSQTESDAAILVGGYGQITYKSKIEHFMANIDGKYLICGDTI